MLIRLMTAALGVVVALGIAVSASAQTVTGTLQGTVTDASGGVLPAATVTIRNLETGATRELTTNSIGFYSAPFLPIGRYTVTAKLNGFATVVREDIDLGLNQTRVADFQMKPAAVAETVTVVGAAPPINTTQRRDQELAHRRADQRQADAQPRQLPLARRDLPGLPGQPDQRPEQSRRRRRARRSTSTAPARAARRSRSTASTTTTRPRIRTARARRSRRSRSSRSSPTPTAPSSGAATARWCWCRRSRAPINGAATSTSSCRTATT